MAKEKYEKLKVLENFIDSSKLVVHNIPKNFGEENLKTLCRKAANGDINKDIAKNARKIVTFHLMLDKSKPDDKDKRYAFFTITGNLITAGILVKIICLVVDLHS